MVDLPHVVNSEVSSLREKLSTTKNRRAYTCYKDINSKLRFNPQQSIIIHKVSINNMAPVPCNNHNGLQVNTEPQNTAWTCITVNLRTVGLQWMQENTPEVKNNSTITCKLGSWYWRLEESTRQAAVDTVYAKYCICKMLNRDQWYHISQCKMCN